MSGERILVIEDEAPLRMALVDVLRANDYVVIEAADGATGIDLALREDPDLILLDLMLPKRDGFSVLKGIREDRLTAPVIILSARGEEWDRIQGFEYGADDYVTKPYSTRELLLRIEASLSRSRGGVPGLADGTLTRFGSVEIDFLGYSLTRAGERHGLSRKEMDLLRYLIDHEGEAIDRLRILADVWGDDEHPTTRTIDAHIRKLRVKIEAEPDVPKHLLTIHGVGYKFVR